MESIVALSGRSLELGSETRKALPRPPPGLVQDILHCAQHAKVGAAIQRVVFVLMQGEPVVHTGATPDDALFEPRALRQFIASAAWSLLVFNMVAFRLRRAGGHRVVPACVSICEERVERGVHADTGEIVYRWVETDEDRRAGKETPFVFSVNPADIGGGWFNSAVMNLREAVHLYNELRANYLAADHAMARPPIPLVYDRTKLFGSRTMGDVALGDVTENNGTGVQDEIVLLQQSIRTNLTMQTGAVLDAARYDMNAASAAGSVAPIYQEVGPMERLTAAGAARHSSGPVLYITPGYAPSSSTYAPSRNNDFLRTSFLEQEISANLGVPLHWMTEAAGVARNTVDSEADADKLKIGIEILRQHLVELFAFIDERLAAGPRDDDLEPECISLRWMRAVEMRTIYVEKRERAAAPPPKRRKTEDDEDKDSEDGEATDEDETKLDPGDINDTA